MNREQVLDILRTHKPTLAERFGVIELALFGSFARNQATERSDVDVLVGFDKLPDYRRYFGAQFYLEDLFERPVNMACEDEIRAEIRPYVEQDAINV
ncbi:MAG: nucleotidyltransferase family protein [Dehalococcoidia bacterium]|nr:nucleotidyltransferase family protein [Dehalococcoidia bacterium]